MALHSLPICAPQSSSGCLQYASETMQVPTVELAVLKYLTLQNSHDILQLQHFQDTSLTGIINF